MAANINNNSVQPYHLSWGLKNVNGSDVYAVTICQRAIRRFFAKLHMREGLASSLYPKMQAWKEREIVRFPRIPLASPSPSIIKKESLLEGIEGSEKAAVEKFLSESVLMHVDYQSFLRTFQYALEETLCFIMSLPQAERGYIIVVDEPQKSNSWMVSLALKQLSVLPPIDVVYKGNVANVLKNRNVRHVLLFDDASYSGKQIATTVDVHLFPCFETPMYNHVKAVHFVIPFLTTRAIEKITKVAASLLSQACFFSSHEIMPLICELPIKRVRINKDDLVNFQKFLQEKTGIMLEDSEGLSLTYFDHKIADDLSIPEKVVKGVVGEIVPPYKAEFDEVLDQYAKEGPESLRVDLLNVEEELSQQFVVIKKNNSYYVYTKCDCEGLQVVRAQACIPLQSLEMIELEPGDVLETATAKVVFDGQKISLEHT